MEFDIMPSPLKLVLYLVLLITFIIMTPAFSMQRTTSIQGPLMDLPIKQFSFDNLALSEALEALCDKCGLLYGIVISDTDTSLASKRTIKLGQTTMRGVIVELSKTYPEYSFNVLPKAVIVIPKNYEKSKFDWLYKSASFKYSNLPPFQALIKLFADDTIVAMSHNLLPAGMTPHSPPLQIDNDGDVLLTTGNYTNTSIIDIIDNLAFNSGQCWALHYNDSIARDEKVVPLFFMPIESIYSGGMVCKLPTYVVSNIQPIRMYGMPENILVKQFDAHGISNIDAFVSLCQSLHILVVIYVKDKQLENQENIQYQNLTFIEILNNIFVNHGFTYHFDGSTGVFYIYPTDNKFATQTMNTRSSLESRINPNFDNARKLLHDYFIKSNELDIRITSECDLSDHPFNMHMPWSQDSTVIKVLEGLARKVNESAYITCKDNIYQVSFKKDIRPINSYIFINVIDKK